MNNFTINNPYNLKIPREGESFTPLAPKIGQVRKIQRRWSKKEIKLLSKVDEYTQSYFVNEKNVNGAEIFAFSANLFNCNTKESGRALHAIGEKRRQLLSINNPLLKTNLIAFVDSLSPFSSQFPKEKQRAPTPIESLGNLEQSSELTPLDKELLNLIYNEPSPSGHQVSQGSQKRKREHTHNEGTSTAVARKKGDGQTTKQLRTMAQLHIIYPHTPWSGKRIIFNNIFRLNFSRSKLYDAWRYIPKQKLTSLLAKSLIRKKRTASPWNYLDDIQLLTLKSKGLQWDELALLFNADNGTTFTPSFLEQRFTKINTGTVSSDQKKEEAQLPEWNSNHDRELIELYSKGCDWEIIADHFNKVYCFTVSPQYVQDHFKAITGYQNV